MPVYVPRLEPWLQNALLYRDVFQQPRVADVVKAPLNVAFIDGGWRRFLSEAQEALGDGIRGGTCPTETVGVGVTCRFSYRVESLFIESLHRPVLHRRNTQRTLLTMTLGDVSPPQWLCPVTALAQG